MTKEKAMLPLYEALEATAMGRTPMAARTMEITWRKENPSAQFETIELYHIEAMFRTSLEAPSGQDAQALADARALIGREVYGEVRHRLVGILHDLRRESYRRPDDPVVRQINDLLRLLDGDSPLPL